MPIESHFWLSHNSNIWDKVSARYASSKMVLKLSKSIEWMRFGGWVPQKRVFFLLLLGLCGVGLSRNDGFDVTTNMPYLLIYLAYSRCNNHVWHFKNFYLQNESYILIRDLKGSRLSGSVFNILFNLNKFMAFETRDPFLIRQVCQGIFWL